MKWMLLPAWLSAGLFVAADAKDDAVKKDMDALQGKWQLVSVERDGKSADVPKDAVRVVKGDTYTVTPRPGVTIEGTFKIDPTPTEDGRYHADERRQQGQDVAGHRRDRR